MGRPSTSTHAALSSRQLVLRIGLHLAAVVLTAVSLLQFASAPDATWTSLNTPSSADARD